MRPIIFLIYSIVALVVGCAYASLPLVTTVKPRDETLILATVGSLDVQVKIKTHEVQIGKASDERPSIIRSSCTYSKYPCSLVDYIDIAVGGNALFVPRSVFCDLADLNRAEVKEGAEGVILTLYGGDASESYIVKIEFDESSVRRRIFSSAISPDYPLQETTYHVQVLGD